MKRVHLFWATFAVLAGIASATTYTWTGGAGDGLFSTPGNWDGNAAPTAATAADNLVFATAGTANNDIAGLTVGDVTVTLASGEQLTITGGKFGGSGTLTKDGAGTLVFGVTNMPNANYSQTIDVNGGILKISVGGDFYGPLTVAEGACMLCSSGTVNFRGPVEISGVSTNTGAQIYYYTRVKGNPVGANAGNTTWFKGGLDGIMTILGGTSKSAQAVFYADTSCFHGYFRTSGEGTIDGRTGEYVQKSGTIFSGMTSSSVTGGITIDNQSNFSTYGDSIGEYVLITNSTIGVTGAFSAGHPGPRSDGVYTTMRLGEGTTVTAHTMQTGGQEANSTMKSFGRIELLPGSVVTATNGVIIGNHYYLKSGTVTAVDSIPRGGVTNEWILVDGGTLNADGIGIGIGNRGSPTCRFYLKSGTVNAEGFYLLAYRNKGKSVTDGGIGIGGRNTFRYVQTGGTLNMGGWGFVAYAREDNSEANVILSGGTLNATKNFPIPYYNPTLFGTWRGGEPGGFTLNTAGHTVTLNTALNGLGEVLLTGSGTVVGTNAMQGVVGGTWTVDGGMSADLRGAASLLGGLSVGANAAVTLDVGANRSAAFFSRDGSWPLNGTSPTVLDRFNESDGGTVATSISHDLGLWNVSGGTSSMPTQHGNSRNVILSKGEFYVDEADAGTWTFSGIYNNHIYLQIDDQSALSADENSYAHLEVALTAGWHRFVVVCEHSGSTCGPNNRTGMAVGFAKAVVSGDAAADYTLFSPKNLKMRPSSPVGGAVSVRWSTVTGTKWADRTRAAVSASNYTNNWDWDAVSLTNSLKLLDRYGKNDPRLNTTAANRWDGWLLVPFGQAGEWRFRLNYDDRMSLFLDGKDIGVESTSSIKTAVTNVTMTAGWHRYEVRTFDSSGSSGPWSGSNIPALSYAVKTAADADFGEYLAFNEDSLTLSLAPDGYLQGEIALASGAAVTNVSETAALVYGDISANGATGAVMAGKFACVSNTVDFGTVAADVNDLSGVLRFDNAATNLFADVGKIAVNFADRPMLSTVVVGPSGGLEALSAEALAERVAVTVDGVPAASVRCAPQVLIEDGELQLRFSIGTIILIR